MACQNYFKIDQSKQSLHRKFVRAKNLHSKEIYHLELYKSMIINLL